MVASTRRLMLLVALVATMLACMVPVTTAQSYNADHERANSEFQAQINKEKKDYQRNLEAKEKAKKSKLAEKEAKKAHEAAKKLDDKIEKRKNIAARQAEMRGGTVPNAHKAQKHRKRKAAEKKADAKAKKQKGHKEL
mmetsp:Transcript_9041/g.21223  ORF Transcript_9041/g.21223 Transcript_9041/m.21223 type:complete len:138 (-) Transcript_9041:252-665(-)